MDPITDLEVQSHERVYNSSTGLAQDEAQLKFSIPDDLFPTGGIEEYEVTDFNEPSDVFDFRDDCPIADRNDDAIVTVGDLEWENNGDGVSDEAVYSAQSKGSTPGAVRVKTNSQWMKFASATENGMKEMIIANNLSIPDMEIGFTFIVR